MLRELHSLRKMWPMKAIDSVSDLRQAVRDGNIYAVRVFAESPAGHPATLPAEKWRTAGYNLLKFALASKEYAIAHLLLTKVHHVNNEESYSHTPLHYAVSDNQEELTRLLLERDAEVDVIDEHDMTPLHYAVLMDNVEIVKMLLDRGARPHDTQDHVFRFTPFQHACKSSKSKILEAFLCHGSDANTVFENPDNLICPKRSSPLHMAIAQRNLGSIHLLLEHEADVNHSNANQETCLHLACRENSAEIVRLLLEREALPNVQSKSGATPLHQAVRHGNEEVVSMLLERGADAKLADREGKIALQLAVEDRQPRIVEMLLAPEHQPDAESCRRAFKKALLENGLGSDMFKRFVKRGYTLSSAEVCEVAFSAVELGYFHIVETLLGYAANVGEEELLLEARHAENGDTLLHCATKRSQHDIVRLLISKKADVQALDEAGNPPVLYAIENDDDHIVKTFITKGDDVWRYPLLLHTIVQTKKKRVRSLLELVLQSGADVNQVDPDLCNSSVLHLICREPMEKDSELVVLLLNYGADINAAASDGSTALHILASRDDSEEIMRVLLRHGPSLEARDAQGCTALHAAASKARQHNIRALLEAGASVNATDDLGMTALDVAAAVERSLSPGDPDKYEKEVKASLELLRREAVKLDVARMRLTEANLKYLTEEGDREFRGECEAELELIDACSVNSNVTLRDVLVRNVRKVVRHMREEAARSSLGKAQYAGKYPIYGRLIEGATGQIMREYKINKAKAAMPLLCGYGLPDSCTESIFLYLRNSELENLSIASTIQVDDGKSS